MLNFPCFIKLQGNKPRRGRLSWLLRTVKKWCRRLHGRRFLHAELAGLQAELVDLCVNESRGMMESTGIHCSFIHAQWADNDDLIKLFKERQLALSDDDEFAFSMVYKKDINLYVCVAFVGSWCV